MIFKTLTLIIINNLLKDRVVFASYGCSSDAQLRSFSPRSGGLGFGVQGGVGFGSYGNNGGYGMQAGGGFGFGFGYNEQQPRPPPQEQPVEIPERQWPNSSPNQMQYPPEPQGVEEPDIGPSANIANRPQVPPQEQPVLPPNDPSERMPEFAFPEQTPPDMTPQHVSLPVEPPLIAPQITLQPTSNASDDTNLPAVAEAPCDNPNLDQNEVNEMCSMPPDKGLGNGDLFRFYYNPIVQQCIPFSYSGKGGNANRFLSVKNCYEICMPAQPDIKNPVPSSGMEAYLVPAPNPSAAEIAAPSRDLVVRQIPNPADPSKTLTIVQSAQYVMGGPSMSASVGAVIEDGTGTTRIVPTLPPKVKIVQRLHHPQYLSPAMPRSQFNPMAAQDNECEDTVYVNSRNYNGYPSYNALSSISYGK